MTTDNIGYIAMGISSSETEGKEKIMNGEDVIKKLENKPIKIILDQKKKIIKTIPNFFLVLYFLG